MNTEATPEFIGWHRANPSARWNPVCHGPSAEIVLTKLFDCIKGGDKAVLAPVVDPNDRPARMQRRRF